MYPTEDKAFWIAEAEKVRQQKLTESIGEAPKAEDYLTATQKATFDLHLRNWKTSKANAEFVSRRFLDWEIRNFLISNPTPSEWINGVSANCGTEVNNARTMPIRP